MTRFVTGTGRLEKGTRAATIGWLASAVAGMEAFNLHRVLARMYQGVEDEFESKVMK